MYQIIKQKRKTATIRIDKNLNVVVKVPFNMSERQIQRYLDQHEQWIKTTLVKKKDLYEKQDWLSTGTILYLGEYIPVKIQKVSYAKELVILNDEGFKIITSGKEDKMRGAVEAFFRREAEKLFTDLTQKYTTLLNVICGKITIRKQETRWGSCSSTGNLSYNVKMMCAPIEMIEYVVLHEVMHLKHFNHSQDFWKDIELVMPDYKIRMNYFKQFGQNFII